jgi:glutathione S-transferase
MAWVSAIVLLALLHYMVVGAFVGAARGRYQIAAPATTGHPVFERWFRVHQNSLELLIAFVPAVWLFGWWVSQAWATGIGLVYVAARVLYTVQYLKDPQTRRIGAGLSFLAVFTLILGCLYKAVTVGLGY